MPKKTTKGYKVIPVGKSHYQVVYDYGDGEVEFMSDRYKTKKGAEKMMKSVKQMAGVMGDGGTIEEYYIFEGWDHYNSKPLYRVDGRENDYVGEWHTDREDAEKELGELTEKMADGGDVSIGQTILQQLGGNKFIVMTGAKHFGYSDKDKTLSFKIGRNASKANYVRIKLTSMDLYDMTFIRIHGANYDELKTYEGLYADMLQSAFTEYTGMYTRLAEGGGVWTIEEETKVKLLDGEFEKERKKKGIDKYSKEASDLWKSGGYQKRMRKIFGKEDMADGGGIPKEDQQFMRFITDQINYIISLKKVSEKKAPIRILIDNMDDYVGTPLSKRITKDNLEYALQQKTASKINKVLKISLNALDYGKMGDGGGVYVGAERTWGKKKVKPSELKKGNDYAVFRWLEGIGFKARYVGLKNSEHIFDLGNNVKWELTDQDVRDGYAKTYVKGGKMGDGGEIFKEYRDAVKKYHDDGVKNFKGDKEMVSMFENDKTDHLSVIGYMKDGNWKSAYQSWYNMDTASREIIPTSAYKLLMKKNDIEEYADGGGVDDYKAKFNRVEVIFENPEYNYSTSVSPQTTEQDAREYFVGQMFNVGVYPTEKMRKVVDIKFYPKGTYAEGGDIPQLDEKNTAILKDREAKYNKKAGPRVGDFLKLPDGTYTRFTYDWGDSIQTGGASRSFYLGNGYISYSGGLDPGIEKSDVKLLKIKKYGLVWFFKDDWQRAGGGIDAKMAFRVFTPVKGADLSGVDSSRKMADGGDVTTYLWVEAGDDWKRTGKEYTEEEFEELYKKYKSDPNYTFTLDADSGKNIRNELDGKTIYYSKKYAFAEGGSIKQTWGNPLLDQIFNW